MKPGREQFIVFYGMKPKYPVPHVLSFIPRIQQLLKVTSEAHLDQERLAHFRA